jgi:hypothetical protein
MMVNKPDESDITSETIDNTKFEPMLSYIKT